MRGLASTPCAFLGLSGRVLIRRSQEAPGLTVRRCFRYETDYKEAVVVLLWVLVALLLLFAIVGGVAISKFLFFVLIVAAILALIGFFTRTA